MEKTISRCAVFHSKIYDINGLKKINELKGNKIEFQFFEQKLNVEIARNLKGFDAVCVFVNDCVDANVLRELKQNGISLVACRCCGVNNVDLKVAKELGIRVTNVPKYSPESIAQHALALLLCLTRKVHKAYNRTKEGNFSIQGLEGMNLYGKTVGIIGISNIGRKFASICVGLGMKLLVTDVFEVDKQTLANLNNAEQVDIKTLLERSDVVSFHCPLTKDNYRMINQDSIKHIKKGQIIINTARGGLIDHSAIIEALRSGQVGGLGMDVYENEQEYFYEDKSSEIIQDSNLTTLMSFPNVIMTAHQAFFVTDGLENLQTTTIENIINVKTTGECQNFVA